MKQLITRIDDDLHARLKKRAVSESRSVNSIVTEAIESAVEPEDPREWLRKRAAARGIKFVERPGKPITPEKRAALLEKTRGLGPVLSEMLEQDRAERF